MDARIEAEIAATAGRQQHQITRDQLLELGLGPSAITYRARNGRLHRVHINVFSLGRPPGAPIEWAAAAVLACGPGAALSHHTALALWGLSRRWPATPHVIAREHRVRPGIVIHRAAGLNRADLRRRDGLRVTSPARTLLDCAPELTDRRVLRIAADGRRAGHLHLGQVADVIGRFPRHPGCARLAPLLDGPPSGPTRSEFEDAFLALCIRYGLPRPQVNTPVCGYLVDALFAAERVIVELDGWDFHRDRHAFEDDRRRDADTLAAGLVTLRITWWRLQHAPRAEAQRLHTILAQRRPGASTG